MDGFQSPTLAGFGAWGLLEGGEGGGEWNQKDLGVGVGRDACALADNKETCLECEMGLKSVFSFHVEEEEEVKRWLRGEVGVWHCLEEISVVVAMVKRGEIGMERCLS